VEEELIASLNRLNVSGLCSHKQEARGKAGKAVAVTFTVIGDQ
jgi:hypothetical protein